MALLKIGTTSETLVTMPHPDGGKGMNRQFSNRIDIEETVLGDVLVTYTGKEKRIIKLNFSNKTKTDFETLKAYAVAQEYWVQIITDAGVKYFDGWAAIILSDTSTDTRTDDFQENFAIEIHEK